MLDVEARRVLESMAASGITLDQLLPAQARAAASAGFAALSASKVDLAEIRNLALEVAGASIPLRLYRAETGVRPALVFFHGGGFSIGNLELYDPFCRRLAAASGCAIVSVGYRLAPEHKFPTAVDDAIAATQWVSAHAAELGIDRERIAVGGDSAGGSLAAVVALLSRDAGHPVLAHQLLLYPLTGWRTDTESYRRHGEGLFLTRALLQYFSDNYLNGPADLEDWRCAPLIASRHSDLPPATVVVCGFDPLHDEGVAYAKTLEQAGVPTQLIYYTSQIHAFLLMDGVVSEASTAIRSIGAILHKALCCEKPLKKEAA